MDKCKKVTHTNANSQSPDSVFRFLTCLVFRDAGNPAANFGAWNENEEI